MADVVPLPLGRGARSAPEFGEPAEFFVDLADPARGLSLTWAPDQQVVQVAIEGADGSSTGVILDADDVLNLVRALVEGLPESGPARPRPPATVLPLRPRPAD